MGREGKEVENGYMVLALIRNMDKLWGGQSFGRHIEYGLFLVRGHYRREQVAAQWWKKRACVK